MRESLRLFALCERTRWNHLPIAGGLYEQDANLLAQWSIIWSKKAEHDKRESEAQKRKAEAKSRPRKR